jgi:hypothetical protein
MAVYTIDGGDGFLGGLAKIARLGAMFVPGMQPWAAAIGAANALAKGDPAGAALSAAGGFAGNGSQAARAAAAPAQAAMTEAERLALASPSNAASLTNVTRDSPVRQGGLIRTAAPQANTSLANTFTNILRNPSEEMGRMFSNPWERTHYMNQRRY